MRVINFVKQRLLGQGLGALIIFVVLAGGCGLFFVAKVPYMWVADGGAHVSRAFQVAQGEWRATYFNHNHGDGYGGYVPKSLDQLRYQQLGLIGKIGKPGFERIAKDLSRADMLQSQKVASLPISKERVKVSFVNTAAYSPVAYAPSAIAIKISMLTHRSLGQTLTLARIFGLITFMISVGYALFTLRGSQTKWIIFTVALLPLVIFQASLITADSTLFSVMLLFSAILIKSWLPKQTLTRVDKTLLLTTAILLPLIKSVYIPVVLLLMTVPQKQWKNQRSYYVSIGVAMLLAVIGFVLWSLATRDIAASNGLVRGDLFWQYGFASQQIHFIVHHPFGFVHAIIASLVYQSRFYVDTTFGWLGYNYLPIPGLSQLAGFFALGLSVMVVEPFTKKMRRTGIAALLAVSAVVILIFTTLYISYTIVAYPVVEGVQGRYILPCFVILLSGLAFVAGNFRVAPKAYVLARNLLIVLVAFSLIFSTIRYGLSVIV